MAAESAPFRAPAEVPGHADVAKLGQALAVLRDLHELMACTAAYSGLRWAEPTALTIRQIDLGARVITVDRKVIEVGGKMYVEAPKNRKQRRTIYLCTTPAWATRWPSGSQPGSSRPAPGRRPAPTRWD